MVAIKRKKPWTVTLVGILTVLGCVTLLCSCWQKTVITETSLKEAVFAGRLSTVEYTYNAVATKKTENGKKDMYYVAYEGTVKAGIDFEEIQIQLMAPERRILITLPPVEIHEVAVDIEKMDYIFVKKQYETEEILTQAHTLCKNDLQTRAGASAELKKRALDSAEKTVRGLLMPLLETVNGEYTVEFR